MRRTGRPWASPRSGARARDADGGVLGRWRGRSLSGWSGASRLALCLFSIVAFLIGGEAVTAWTQARLAEPGSRMAIGALLFLLLAGDIVLPVPSSLAATGRA